METLEIKISSIKNDEEIAKRTTENWEVAEQNLESLKRWWQREGYKIPELVMSPKDVPNAY